MEKSWKQTRNNAEKTGPNTKYQRENVVQTFGMFPRDCMTTEQKPTHTEMVLVNDHRERQTSRGETGDSSVSVSNQELTDKVWTGKGITGSYFFFLPTAPLSVFCGTISSCDLKWKFCQPFNFQIPFMKYKQWAFQDIIVVLGSDKKYIQGHVMVKAFIFMSKCEHQTPDPPTLVYRTLGLQYLPHCWLWF